MCVCVCGIQFIPFIAHIIGQGLISAASVVRVRVEWWREGSSIRYG